MKPTIAITVRWAKFSENRLSLSEHVAKKVLWGYFLLLLLFSLFLKEAV